MGKIQKFHEWFPTVSAKRPDTLKSHESIERGELGFKPTYETKEQPKMRLLLTNEYMRMWFKERDQYDKDVYSKLALVKSEGAVKRRFVQKMEVHVSKRRILPPMKKKIFRGNLFSNLVSRIEEDRSRAQNYKHKVECVMKNSEHFKRTSKSTKDAAYNCPKNIKTVKEDKKLCELAN